MNKKFQGTEMIYEDCYEPKKSYQKSDRKKTKTSLRGLVESGRDINTIRDIVYTDETTDFYGENHTHFSNREQYDYIDCDKYDSTDSNDSYSNDS